MMNKIKLLRILILLIVLFFNQNLYSQNKMETESKEIITKSLDFYKYVIDQYISILESNYSVDDSIIIYVDLYCNDVSNNFSLTLRVTDRYSKIIEFEYSPFYKYNNQKDIYIVFARFQGYPRVESDFCHAFDAEIVRDSTLIHVFYPITYEFAKDHGLINTLGTNSKVFKVEKFEVDYNLKNIRTRVNGRSENYFRNYKSDIKISSEKI